ncbi:MAG: NAD(P)H-hydrate dehydratase [Chloroflexi bacterium]|nr:NAD(P)H-hydrate dehydratase [Chloroflexota bacterium]MCY4246301.1 NAD(P)H-hydrate dehydratase [Chloroflexota bacterium]
MAPKVASAKQARQIEAAADQHGLSYARMMQNAGAAACQLLLARVAVAESTRVLFLIGKGNNGGDGLVMARQLAQSSEAAIHLLLIEARSADDEVFRAATAAGLPWTVAADSESDPALRELAGKADVIVDALLGIGGRPPLRARLKTILTSIRNATRQTNPYVLAIDCPSGIDCDSGEIDNAALSANATISFIAAKPGLLTFPAAAAVGELVVSQIGIADELDEWQRVSVTLMDAPLARSLLPARPLDGHKGTFGKAMVVAGCANYIGAAALAGEAAYRSGAGLVTVATTRQLIDNIASSLREPTWLPLASVDGCIAHEAAQTVLVNARAYQSLLVGCGLGLHASTQAFVRSLLDADLPPLLLDADALNSLSQLRDWWERLPANTIITPHIGEMARLTGRSTAEIAADRWSFARRYAKQWQVVVLLKGAHTLIAAPDGQTSVIPVKTDALGTAGTGDVLAGLISGLRAQGLAAFDSARLGAYIHALAGTIAAQAVGSSRSVIATDVLTALGSAFAATEVG